MHAATKFSRLPKLSLASGPSVGSRRWANSGTVSSLSRPCRISLAATTDTPPLPGSSCSPTTPSIFFPMKWAYNSVWVMRKLSFRCCRRVCNDKKYVLRDEIKEDLNVNFRGKKRKKRNKNFVPLASPNQHVSGQLPPFRQSFWISFPPCQWISSAPPCRAP